MANENTSKDIGLRVRTLRKDMDLTLASVSKLTGIKPTTMQRYEAGDVRTIPFKAVEQLADLYHCSPSYIMGWDANTLSVQESQRFIPIYGSVCAGNGAVAYQEKLGEVPVFGYMSTDNFFALKIKGDSMMPELRNGDTVIVKRNVDVESGDTVVAMVNSEEATCKKIHKYDHGIALIPNNPLYEPMRFTEEDVIDGQVIILGKVVEIRRKY